MAQAFINRSLRQFVRLRRPLPTDTHRVARVLEENVNLFVRRRRRNERLSDRRPARNRIVRTDG